MISVIMAVYNETSEELRKAIKSICSQTYIDFEYIIILDNPNNVRLKKIINYYSNKDKRIRVILNEKNIGLAASLNRGIELSRGEYIARMDADDISSKNRLMIQKKYLDDNPDVSVVSGNMVMIDENGNIIKQNYKLDAINRHIEKTMKLYNVIVHPCVMFRSKDIKEVEGYREIPAIEDYDLWIRMLLIGKKIRIIDKVLLKYRIRNNSITNKNTYLQRTLFKTISKSFSKSERFDIGFLNSYINSITENHINNYEKSVQYYIYAWELLHKKRIFLSIYMFIKSIKYDKEVINILIETLKFYLLLKL